MSKLREHLEKGTPLLDALRRGKPGIQINMGRGTHVTVRLMYDPWVYGVGRTLTEAIEDCVRWLRDVLKDHPELRDDPNLALVLADLDATENG